MHLQFEFTDGRDAVALPFFENKKNNISDLPELERKTKNWKMIFSKMAGAEREYIIKPELLSLKILCCIILLF